MKSLLIVISEEYLSKGIAIALMDSFQSIHTTKNPYEAVEILIKENIDIIITEVNFNTIETDNYIDKLINLSSSPKLIILIKDSKIKIDLNHLSENIVIEEKPISVQHIKTIISSVTIN